MEMKVIKLSAFLLAVVASGLFATEASAAAQCEGPTLWGNTWNLVCSADAEGDSGDDYQCHYIVSLAHSEGEPDQEEATGSVTPGASGVIIWSAAVNDEDDIVSAAIDSGSCSQ